MDVFRHVGTRSKSMNCSYSNVKPLADLPSRISFCIGLPALVGTTASFYIYNHIYIPYIIIIKYIYMYCRCSGYFRYIPVLQICFVLCCFAQPCLQRCGLAVCSQLLQALLFRAFLQLSQVTSPLFVLCAE